MVLKLLLVDPLMISMEQHIHAKLLSYFSIKLTFTPACKHRIKTYDIHRLKTLLLLHYKCLSITSVVALCIVSDFA